MRVTSPGIGHKSSLVVSVASRSGMSAASSAWRGVRTRTSRSAPRRRIRKPWTILSTRAVSGRPSTSSRASVVPGVQSEVTRWVVPPSNRTVAPSRSASMVSSKRSPASVTTQSAPTRRSWLSIRPEIRARRISETRCIAAAQAASARRSSCGSVAPEKPSGKDSSMKAVVMSPEAKSGCSMTASRKGRLWPMPSISNAPSASRMASMAPPRSGAQAQSLAIIGS